MVLAKIWRDYKLYLALLAFLVLGLILRLHNISSYKFYPDSYQNLVVADNLRNYNSPVGSLGPDGMGYPQTFAWTRPLYASLINIAKTTCASGETAGKAVALGASLLTIPASCWLVWQLTKRRKTAVIAGLLAAINFGLVVWGGFILTETLGVLVVLLLLGLVIRITNIKSPANIAPFVLAGLLFSLCVLCRYEYLVLALPVLLILQSKKTSWEHIVITFASAIVALAIFFIFYPLPLQSLDLTSQLKSQLPVIVAAAIALIAVFIIKGKIASFKWPRKLVVALASTLTFILLIYMARQPGWRDFMANDFILVILAAAGYVVMLAGKKYRAFALFSLLAIFMLSAIYLRVNTDMFRYFTHLFPFLIVPAAIGATFILSPEGLKLIRSRYVQKLIPALLFLGIILQVGISYNGLHNWDDGVWFKPGYEEVSAKMSRKYLAKNSLVVASLPEPYYFFTGHSTYSLNDNSPYIYIDSQYDNVTVNVIYDMPMQSYFPHFSQLISQKLPDYKKTTLYTGQKYIQTDHIVSENMPVTIYELKLSELKRLVANQ